jgi:hypothetical protein
MTKKRRESRFIGSPDELKVFSSVEEAKEYIRKAKEEFEARYRALEQKQAKDNSTEETHEISDDEAG